MKKITLAIFILCLCCMPATGWTDSARVQSFVPQGVAKNVRQVSVKFSDPMIALGTKAPDPFDMIGAPKGQGRWVDTMTWVYDYPVDLPGGIVAIFKLKSGLKTLAGKEVYGQREFRFTTGGPTVQRVIPYDGSGAIDEEQAFVLTLDDAATPESITANSYFMVSGIRDKIGVRILDGEVRQQVLASQHVTADNDNPANTVLVQAKQVFPTNATVTLVWGKGIRSATGIATESEQIFHYTTRPPFTVSLTCERENAGAGCVPFLPMQLEFSSMVPWEVARNITLHIGKQSVHPTRQGDDTANLVRGVTFEGPFPENSDLVFELPGDMRDDAGRVPVNRNRYPLHVMTGVFPPLAKFSARFGIIEKADPVLPVTLRNVEEQLPAMGLSVDAASVVGKSEVTRNDLDVISWLKTLAVADRRHSIFDGSEAVHEFSMPRVHGRAAFEVVGIPLQQNGLHLVELRSELLGAALLADNSPMYVPTAALVTNMSAHFKWGRESSLVWVTALDTGAPVPGASVTIRDCSGKELWQGSTDAQGIARIPKNLRANATGCGLEENEETFWDYPQMGALRGLDAGLYAFVHTANDMTFVHSSWNQGIEPWRYRLTEESGPPQSLRAHTVLDRSLLRAGDTLHMKHYLRRQSGNGFEFPTQAQLPKVVVLSHIGSQEYYELPLKWDLAGGIAESTWHIPAKASLGNYAITLYKDVANGTRSDLEYCDDCWFTGQFKVAEFRVPLMKGVIQGTNTPLVRPSQADFDVHLSYLSGGGAGAQPITLRSMIEPLAVSFDDFEGYSFCNGAVQEGIQNKGEDDEAPQDQTQVLQSSDGVLGVDGSLHMQVAGMPEKEIPQTLTSELEFKDPSGETQTVTRRDQVWPASVLPGIQMDEWAGESKIRCTAVAVGQDGKAVAGASMRIGLFKKIVYAHRKRLVGGFYAYENTTEIKRVGQVFDGKTDAKGQVQVEIPAPKDADGEIIVQADVTDAADNTASVHRSIWLYGDDEWSFEQTDNDRIDLLPEKKAYEPGETATFQVRMPFMEATVLVTVEREGILDATVQHLNAEAPVITVPIKGNYGPNIYVSALCLRGRVAAPEATALVDLARPAFKLGIAKLKVGWKDYGLDVHVRPEKDTFKVRQQAPVTITVQRSDGRPLPAGAEVAISAVDEGLLELMPNTSWNLLDAMMQLRPYEVETSTAQMQVVGKRHFGLKALPHGGGGGMQTTRELFDTLLLWQGRVRLDAEGQARVSIPLNDSLTSFRIVAVAQAGPALFGTGQTTIRTTQDLMILSGLPQIMRQGDRFQAVFTVRNGLQSAHDIVVHAQTQAGDTSRTLPDQKISLGPGEAREVRWDFTAPEEESLGWLVTAGDGGELSDTLRVWQKLIPPVQEHITQAFLAQLAPSQQLDVQQPEGSLPGRGGVKVLLSSSLVDGQQGVQNYLAGYPHSCLEQRLSRAVGLHDEKMWQGVQDDLLAYLDDDGLAKYFPSCLSGSDTLTAYVLSMAHETGRKLPVVARERMLTALDGFVKGRIERRPALPTKDLMIRRLAALEALSRYGRATAKDLESVRIEPNQWPTSALLDWISLLDRIQKLPGRNDKLAQAYQILRTRLNIQGTTLSFSTERSDDLPWLMANPDVNAVRAVCVLSKAVAWKDDVPKMLRAAIGRQRHGSWSTTVANAWGVVALDRFAGRFESGAVNGTTDIVLADNSTQVVWSEGTNKSETMLPWPQGRSELRVKHDGTGSPWMTVQTWAAEIPKESRSSGFTVQRSIQPVIVRNSGRYSVGDVIRVRLDCTAQADASWVAVQDFIPCGSTILGQGFDRESRILALDEKNHSVPDYEERSFTAYRAYYEFRPKGAWSVEYTVRLNTAGEFRIPGTRIEALYAPEMFGELPPTSIRVE